MESIQATRLLAKMGDTRHRLSGWNLRRGIDWEGGRLGRIWLLGVGAKVWLRDKGKVRST